MQKITIKASEEFKATKEYTDAHVIIDDAVASLFKGYRDRHVHGIESLCEELMSSFPSVEDVETCMATAIEVDGPPTFKGMNLDILIKLVITIII